MTPTNDTYQTEIVLELEEGSEHKLQINTDISVTADIMYPVFHAAEVAVAGIIRSSEQFLSREQLVSKSELGNDLYGYANNIIAFSGQRGQGKTSAMLSFSEALKEYNEAKPKKLHLSQAEQFYVLDPIDPSMLQEDSALNVILSRLYQMARTAMKNLQTSENGYAATKIALEQSSREMIVQFQRCLSGVRALSGASKAADVDDFESLSNLVDGLRLKNQLYELVKNFLRLNDMDVRSGYIVIQLDDTDLQLKNAYNVLDDICKYMTLPNVIILMATDMEQLQILVEQHYMEELKCSFDSKLVDNALLQKMAIKYLDKLIPVSQVIRLPSLNAAFESSKPVQIKVIRNERAVGKIEDVQNKFLAMIYEKTGIAYVGSDEMLHCIMPTTLRGLRHFYRFLNETLADCGERPSVFELTMHKGQERVPYMEQYRAWIARREQNLATFENYFLDDWCSGHLPQEYKNDLRSISEAPRDQMNRYMNMFLNRLQKSKKPVKDSTYCSLFRRVSALTNDVDQCKDGNLASALKTILAIHLQRISLKDRMVSLETLPGQDRFYPAFKMLEKYIGHLPFDGTAKTASARGASKKGRHQARSVQSVSELFMVGLVPENGMIGNYYHEDLDSKGEDSVRDGYYIDIAEQHQNYAVTVCCNPELQELIGSYVGRPLKDLPKAQQKGFRGNVSEYYDSLMTELAERCEYLYPEETRVSTWRDMHSTQFALPPGMVEDVNGRNTTAPTVARNDIQNCIERLGSLIYMIGDIKRPDEFGPDMAKSVGNVIEYVVTTFKHDTTNEIAEIVQKSHEAARATNDLAASSNKSREKVNGICTRLKNLRKKLEALPQ